MKMLVAALIGGIVLGLVDTKLLLSKIQGLVTDPGIQGLVNAATVAFLGVIWGWVAKGLLGSKAKE
jgi:hypothetical protein